MLSSRQQQPIAIGAALIGLMAATRFHQFGASSYLPDAAFDGQVVRQRRLAEQHRQHPWRAQIEPREQKRRERR